MTVAPCPTCQGKGKIKYDCTLLELLRAYVEIMERKDP